MSQRHFHGVRRREIPTRIDDPKTFTFEEVYETFVAFASDSPMPRFLRWEQGYSSG